jgi:hypothetical protein
MPTFNQSGTFATSANVYPPAAFGQEVRFRDNQTGSSNAGCAWAVLCQGSNVASAGQFVQIINNSAVLLTNGNSGSIFPVGIAGAPASATNVWCWVGVDGKFDNGAYTNVAFTIPGSAYLPKGTAGQLASSAASNEYLELRGVVLPNSFTSTDGSATSLAGAYCALTVELDRPFLLGRGATNAAW